LQARVPCVGIKALAKAQTRAKKHKQVYISQLQNLSGFWQLTLAYPQASYNLLGGGGATWY